MLVPSVAQEEAVVNQCLSGVNTPSSQSVCDAFRALITWERPPDASVSWQESKANRVAFACLATLLSSRSTACPLLWLQSSIPRQLSQQTNYWIKRSNKAPPTPAPTALRILACVAEYLSVSAAGSGKKHEIIIIIESSLMWVSSCGTTCVKGLFVFAW